MMIVESPFPFEIDPKATRRILWRPFRRRVSPRVARRTSRCDSGIQVTVIYVCACSCRLVVVINEGADLGYWDGFTTDEDLYDLSQCDGRSGGVDLKPREIPAQYLPCRVNP